MTISKAIQSGVIGNELSKVVTGTSDISVSRTVVATGSGAAVGACATSAAIVIAGTASAPITIPFAVASGIVAGIASLCE